MSAIRRLILAFALAAGLVPAAAFAQAPPAVPALPDTERRTTYSISGTTCACAVGFQLYGDSTDFGNWVEVFINEILISPSNYTITSPTGSLATIPRPITDAVLTFNSVQTGTVQIVGARRPRRAVQFTEGRGVAARDLNQAITDIVAMLREDWDKINDVTGRTVLAPPGETLALLPIKSARANQGACFDTNGNLINCVSVPSSTFSAGSNITFTGTNPTVISTPGYTATIAAGTGISVSGTCTSSTALNCTITNTVTVPTTDPKAGRFLPIITGTVSGTACSATSPFTCMQFCQYKGNQILVNGTLQNIPSGQCVSSTGGIAGAYNQACIENSSFVTTCNQTLSANTLYYAYIGLITGTPTMIWSTNTHSPSLGTSTSVNGNEIMTGDATRSLVGMCQTNGTSKFDGTGSQQNCATWFNPIWNGLSVAFSGTFSAATYTAFGPCSVGSFTACLTWVQWSDNVPTIHANCVLSQNSGGNVNVTAGIGVSSPNAAVLPSATSAITVDNGTLLRQLSVDQPGAVGTEGFVIANFLGLSNGAAVITAASCQLQIPSRIPS